MTSENIDRPKVQAEEEAADLRVILELLKTDFRKLTAAIDFNTENVRKLAMLVNAGRRSQCRSSRGSRS